MSLISFPFLDTSHRTSLVQKRVILFIFHYVCLCRASNTDRACVGGLDNLHFFLPHLLWFQISNIKVMPGLSPFEIKLDVQRCKREDITVKFVDECLVVQTRKVQPDDNSIVARKYSKRTYPVELSKYDKDSLHYEFDDHGMLNIQIQPIKTKADETTK